jgi:FKBP-type peptidyl-prolyl cis-trans isomerase FkpA
MRNWKQWLGGVTLLALVGCGGEEADSAGQAEPMPVASETAPAIDLSAMTQTNSGLYLLDLVVGEGEEAVPQQTVTVHYTGWFLDGEKFDSSVDKGETFEFPLGAGGVIAGWDEGVAGMRIGGKRRLVIPPELAYGAAGRSGIPPNSTLVFDVELFGVGEG